MSPAEVDAALGMPPGYHGKKPPKGFGLAGGPFGDIVREVGLPSSLLPDRSRAGDAGVIRVERWIWEDYWIWVAYDANEKVFGYYLLEEGQHQKQNSSLGRPQPRR